MENIETELLEFYDYLEKKRQTIGEQLQPYYEQLDARLNACMNAYGIANPKEKCLMRELACIMDIKRRLRELNSFNKLEESLLKDVEENENSKSLQVKIEIIKEYKLFKNGSSTNKKI